ncbi:hypothetical protein LB456_07645 [Psychroflexus sp. CAK57W]|uniref:hypothetical protein n=1 Tax=Psychroflexus curvus TaxID=2873595 RepID=UPI001CCF3006|nr:hypothetical protein [Psychroflexus curvus]MBZ9628946.1 hypothetical protein [Psychroflexus curvus]MBZ9787332.1 hypothetical protein [Psychroflexus curvus]
MRKFLLVMSLVILGSCKSDSKTTDAEENILKTESNTISGEFIYTDSVAVFNKEDEIYGVIMNEKASQLIAQARDINPDPFASFDVTLKAAIKDNPEKEAWPQVIDIQTIIRVKPLSNDDSLRLNKQE